MTITATCIALCVALSASGGALAADIENGLRTMVRSADLRDTRVGIYVMDLDSGRVMADIGGDELMIPASNMKLLTTAVALDVLGTDFAFRTVLAVTEQPGARRGPTLVVLGDGDPAFGDPQLLAEHDLDVEDLLDQWAAAAAATGIRKFDQLLVDDRVFDRQFVHDGWPTNQLHKRYCAQVAGLNFYDNVLDITPVPGSPGQSPRVIIYPPAPFLVTSNRAETGRNNMFHIDRKMGTNDLSFRGSIRNKPAEPWQVTIHDPPMFFAEMLAERLRQQGITVVSITRPGDTETLPTVRPLHVVRTTLPMVLNRTNADSQNMFAEALFKRVGRQITGTPGSWRNGAAAMRIALRQRLGTRSAALQISDGSGMSRDNRVTARMLVELLAGVHNDNDPEKARIFRESLAHAGNADDGEYEGTGTFEKGKRFSNLPPGHDVFGKSGYINGVSTLSGYLVVPDEDGNPRTIAFSLLFNDFKPPVYVNQIKALQNRLVELIDDSVSAPAKLGG